MTVVLALCALSAAAVPGPAGQLSESEIKAQFLFNLTKFVEWPDGSLANTHAPIVLGVMGTDPLVKDLNRAVNGQTVKGHSFEVHKYDFGDDLRGCHVLFLSASEQTRIPHLLTNLLGVSILTVSDTQRFAEAGGVIQFSVEDDRVHFVVNRDAAAQAKLKISAQLLTLARVYSHGGASGTN